MKRRRESSEFDFDQVREQQETCFLALQYNNVVTRQIYIQIH